MMGRHDIGQTSQARAHLALWAQAYRYAELLLAQESCSRLAETDEEIDAASRDEHSLRYELEALLQVGGVAVCGQRLVKGADGRLLLLRRTDCGAAVTEIAAPIDLQAAQLATLPRRRCLGELVAEEMGV